MDLTFTGSYATFSFTASDFTSITNHIHNWVLFLLWLHVFILSGVISSLISSSILGTCQPGEFIFQCSIFLPFHTAHGVLKARILIWFSIPPLVNHILSELSTVTSLSWMALPIRTRPSFPHSQSLPSGSFHKPLILIPQREDRMKTTIREN